MAPSYPGPNTGAPAETRIGRFLLILHPSDGMVSAKMRYQDYDASGNLVNTANVTFTGRSIADDIDIDDGDPFWMQ